MVIQGLGDHEFKLLVCSPENLGDTPYQTFKLDITKGDALDPISVKEIIADMDVLIYSIGNAFDIKTRSMVSPGLCQDTMTVIFKVMDKLPENEHPKCLVAVSTTGLEGGTLLVSR